MLYGLKARMVIWAGNTLIDILAEHPDANKTQTARKIIRDQLLDFQNQIAEPDVFRMGEVFQLAGAVLSIIFVFWAVQS